MATNERGFLKKRERGGIPAHLPGLLGVPYLAKQTLLNPNGFLNNMGPDPQFSPSGPSGANWQRGTSSNALGGGNGTSGPTQALAWQDSTGRTITAFRDPWTGTYFTSFGDPVTPPAEATPVAADAAVVSTGEEATAVPGEAGAGGALGPEGAAGASSEDIQGGVGTDTLIGSARGIRNNNPGNIEFGAFAKSQGATRSDGRFAVFPTPEQGIAAIYALQGKYESGGQTTVTERIAKWAPPGENNSKAYAAEVARQMGIPPDQPFNIKDPVLGPAFVDAMIQVENGSNPYQGETVQAAQSVALGAPQAGLASPVVPPKLARFVENPVSGAPPAEGLRPTLSPRSMEKYLGPDVPTEEPVAGTDPESEATLLDIGGSTATPLRVKVQKGDTLWEIAKDHLGDGQRWPEIAAANNIPKGAEKRLQIGTVLDVPGAIGPPTPPMRPGAAEAAPAPPSPSVPPSEWPSEMSTPAAAPQPQSPSVPPDQWPVDMPQPDITEDELSRGFGAPPKVPEAPSAAGSLTLSPGLADEMQMENPPQRQSVVQAAPSVTAPPPPTLGAGAVITDTNPPPAGPSPEQMQQSYDTRSDQRLESAIEQVPSVGERVKSTLESIIYGPDSAFNIGLLPETETIAGRTTVVSPDDLDLTTPAKPPPATTAPVQPSSAAPAVPSKDQSRIQPSSLPTARISSNSYDVPVPQRGAAPAAPAPAAPPVAAPRDTVSGKAPAARSAADFQPLAPSAFKGRSPLAAQNAFVGKTNDGTEFAAYDQNGYRVTSFDDGYASRTSLTGQGVPETYSASTGSWVPTGGPPISTLTTPERPPASSVTWSNATSGAPVTTTPAPKPTATPTNTYSSKPTVPSNTGFVGNNGMLSNI